MVGSLDTVSSWVFHPYNTEVHTHPYELFDIFFQSAVAVVAFPLHLVWAVDFFKLPRVIFTPEVLPRVIKSFLFVCLILLFLT